VLEGKGSSWDKLDLVSSVVEVTADANDIAGPVFAKIAWALDHNLDASWRELLIGIRNKVGDSTFGASGVRENCFGPNGSLCETGGTGGSGGTGGAGGASGGGGAGGASGGSAGAGAVGGGGGTSASCVGHCASPEPAPGSDPACYCDDSCTGFGDCCDDFAAACQ
jgi:hypothetical protein